MIQLLLVIIYLAFISLGLPDALLGAAWPSMYEQLRVPVSYAGILSMIIALGTIVSSLMSDRLTIRLGAGKVTAISVGMTALALLGFSFSRSFLVLCLWAVPYGLGAGSVDAALNSYVALHYESKHMSWLHCMWGVGASAGPYLMGYVLTGGGSWNGGYRLIGTLQIALTILLVVSLPLWNRGSGEKEGERPRRALSLPRIIRIPGAKAVMLCFFCYCAVEQTAGLWSASYLTLCKGIPAETAAGFASMFYLGITAGRAFCGFITMKRNDTQMVKLGLRLIAVGILAMLLPGGSWPAIAGLILIGLGCAPIYPSMLHATPDRFGPGQAQAIFGVQMASAYVGTCVMPPLFGILAGRISAALLPVYLLGILVVMAVMFSLLQKRTAAAGTAE